MDQRDHDSPENAEDEGYKVSDTEDRDGIEVCEVGVGVTGQVIPDHRQTKPAERRDYA